MEILVNKRSLLVLTVRNFQKNIKKRINIKMKV